MLLRLLAQLLHFKSERSTMMRQAASLLSPLRQSKDDNLVKQALDAHASQPPPVEPPSGEAVRTLLSKVRRHLQT